MDNSICALVVTYNRKEYLLKLLKALDDQTIELNTILIFDNHSTDNTRETLLSMGIINSYKEGELSENKKIKYYYNDKNTGGSGGFNKGIQMAYELGYDYIWCMDDDVLPEKKCLEELRNNLKENVGICVPSRTDKKYVDHAIVSVNQKNPFLYSIRARKKQLVNEKIVGDTIKVVDMPFEGPLIKRSVISQIGLPNKDLFIIFDDTEYATRASKIADILYCKKAILHKQIIPTSGSNKLMGWKEYYGIRNQIWFDVTYGKNKLVKYFRPRFLYLDLCFRAFVKRKDSNINVIKKAYRDGIRGQLGMRVNPGTLGKDIK